MTPEHRARIDAQLDAWLNPGAGTLEEARRTLAELEAEHESVVGDLVAARLELTELDRVPA